MVSYSGYFKIMTTRNVIDFAFEYIDVGIISVRPHQDIPVFVNGKFDKSMTSCYKESGLIYLGSLRLSFVLTGLFVSLNCV